MSDQGFHQFRVEQVGEIEFDVEGNEEAVMRIFLTSRTDDQIALEVPRAMWAELFGALSAGLKKFPPQGLKQ